MRIPFLNDDDDRDQRDEKDHDEEESLKAIKENYDIITPEGRKFVEVDHGTGTITIYNSPI